MPGGGQDPLPEDTLYRQLWPSTLASTAMQLREDVRNEVDDGTTVRDVIQAADDFTKLTSPADRAFFLAEPGPTGSRRFDALLAGLAVHLCREAGLETTPAWTRARIRFLDEIWWFGRTSESVGIRAMTLRDCVPSMRSRGVMFSRRNLESV